MKKIIFTALLMVLSWSSCFSQNSVVNKLIIPRQDKFVFFKEIKKDIADTSFNKSNIVTEPENKFQSFISNLPLIKIKEATLKKPFSFFTELSFPDIFENSFKINSGLVRTYDDELPELFKDAPYAIKLHLSISL